MAHGSYSEETGRGHQLTVALATVLEDHVNINLPLKYHKPRDVKSLAQGHLEEERKSYLQPKGREGVAP